MAHFYDLIAPYQSILLLEAPWVGFLVAVITFLQPNIALCGVLGISFGLLLLKLIQVSPYAHYRGTFLLNALLVGGYLGDLFVLDRKLVVLIFIFIGMTLLFSVVLNSYLAPSGLPILSLPFCVVALVIAASKHQLSNFSDASFYLNSDSLPTHFVLPLEIQQALRSIGTLFCVPDLRFGACLLGIVALYSPMTSIFFILGYGIGAEMEKFLSFSSFSESGIQSYGFNYALIFTAVAGRFLTPSPVSFLWGIFATGLGVLVTLACSAFLGVFHIPVLALPFNIILLLVLRTLHYTTPFRLTSWMGDSPEAALERSRFYWLRYRSGEVGVFCPVEGEWLIQQGFQGTWTHRGHWQHALDFVIQGDNQKTHKNQGIELTDYFAYDQPILAPISGVVTQVCSSLPDNPIGKVENQQNWGNFIIIRSSSGIYVTLAHLKQDSISVKSGDVVTAGQLIARCGNSGYSQEPHLHLQVQLTDLPGAYTIPFHLLNYKVGDQVVFNGVPSQGGKITPLNVNKILDRVLSFPIGQKLEWSLNQTNADPISVSFSHLLDEKSGRSYWTDGKSRLYYSKVGAQFYFYDLDGKKWSPIWDLLTAAPCVPMSFGDSLTYSDILPLSLTHGKIHRFFVLFLQFISSKLDSGSANYILNPIQLDIHGKVTIRGNLTHTYLKMDPLKGMVEFKVGERHYVRT